MSVASISDQQDPLSSVMVAVLNEWERIERQRGDAEDEFARRHGVSIEPAMVQARDEIRSRMRGQVAAFIGHFERDNSALSANELAAVAGAVSPGGAHTGGLLVRLVRAMAWHADPLLVAATIYHNWHGGKVGFQFLPDPASMEAEDYGAEAAGLIENLGEATEWDPRRLLIGGDCSFFDRLPERFTIYRGCNGIGADAAGAGVCWTTSRAMAEWFALRGDGAPIVLTAAVRKRDVVLVNAIEAEVVIQPRNPRPIAMRAWSEAKRQRAKDADVVAASTMP